MIYRFAKANVPANVRRIFYRFAERKTVCIIRVSINCVRQYGGWEVNVLVFDINILSLTTTTLSTSKSYKK